MNAPAEPGRGLKSFGRDEEALGYTSPVGGFGIIRPVLPYLRPYMGRFLLMVALTVLGSSLKIGVLVFLKPGAEIILGTFDVDAYAHLPLLGSGVGHDLLVAFADVFSGSKIAALGLLIGAVLVTMTLQAIADLGAAYLQSYVGGHVGMDVQRGLVDRLLAQPIGFYQARGKGELVSVVSQDSLQLYRLFYVFFDRLVRATIEAGGALAIALVINWRLTLFAAAVLGPIGAIFPQFSRRMRKRERQNYHFWSVSSLIVQEMVAAPMAIKAYVMERYFRDRLEWARRKQYRRYMSLVKARAWLGPSLELVFALVISAFLFYTGRELMAGRLQVGEMAVLYGCLLRLIEPIRKGGKGFGEFVLTSQGVHRVLDLMARVPAVRDAPGAADLAPVAGRIEFRDVHFSYRADQPALAGVSFTIAPGERVALVGPSGAGKSTIAALLLRLYDPDSGSILIDDQAIATVRQESLRRQVGLVTQATTLFSDTVRMNITCGVPAEDEAVIAAAQAAQAHDFILQLPDGYDTDLGDMGTDLSGGQRQRLAVARCLFRNTPILILDEATSSLDAIAEAELQSAIEVMTSGRTTIIIAHRFSTILSADRLILVNEGRVQGTGTHHELFDTNALYRELLQRQMLTIDQLNVPSPTAST